MTSRWPGSDIAGVPASEMRATFWPCSRRSRDRARFAALAEFVEADETCGDLQALQQDAALAGVFARDDIRVAKRLVALIVISSRFPMGVETT